MKLYGSTTSPYARRVRIVATELGVPFELLSTLGEEGQKRLREVTPIWKAPVADIDGELVFDSHVIVEHMLRRHGYGPLRTAGGPAWLPEHNLLTVIDGALDAGAYLFQLVRDGVDLDSAPYFVKQRDRIASALGWLEQRLRGPWLTDEPRLGLAEIALVTALDWMIFRERFPVESHPALEAFRAHHADRPSIKSTVPTE
jgi:glutathione S-transferase